MAHQISEISGRSEVFTAGELPWHGLGINVKELQTAAGALQLAGLDWEVYKRPIYMDKHLDESDSNMTRAHALIEDKVANCRKHKDGSDCYLGVVGADYKILQNTEAFDFMDQVVGAGQAVYDSAGAIRNGRRVWLSVKLPDNLIVGKKDEIQKYLFLANGHDGSMAVHVRFTNIRICCSNTLSAALAGKSPAWIKIQHRGDVMAKVKTAQEVLGVAKGYYEEIGDVFNQMFLRKMNDSETHLYFRQVFPRPELKEDQKESPGFRAAVTRHENLMSSLQANYEGGAGAEMSRGSLWGAFNAVTENLDHGRWMGKPSNPEARFSSIMMGSVAETRQRAFEEAVDLLPV